MLLRSVCVEFGEKFAEILEQTVNEEGLTLLWVVNGGLSRSTKENLNSPLRSSNIMASSSSSLSTYELCSQSVDPKFSDLERQVFIIYFHHVHQFSS